MQKNKKVKNFMKYIFLGIFLLAMVGLAIAGTPTYTYLSDSTSWFNGKVGIGTDTPTAELEVVGDGTGNGLFIDQNGNGNALNIDSEATTTNVININAVNTDGHTVWIQNDAIHTDSSNALLKIHQQNTDSSTDVKGAWIENAAGSIGDALFIEQN